MRLSYEEMNALKKKFDVDRIWSFSRISSFLNCAWEYKMKYIDKERVNTDNVYTVFGTQCHDIIQDFYAKKYDYKTMTKLWDEFITSWKNDPVSYQFDTEKIKNGYLNNIDHYFKHCSVVNEPIEGKKEIEVINEKPVLIQVESKSKQKHIFVGYVDSEYYDHEGNLVLLDYKTSSKTGFTPKKLPEKSMQLILYAIGKHQITGLPYEKIKCRFDMMKYCRVHYQLESGGWKTSIQERSEWVYKMASKLKTKLPKVGCDPIEVDELITQASLDNDMWCLPEEVANQFYIENYYIEVEITEQICKELNDKVAALCDKILDFEQIEDLETELEINYPFNPDDYFCKKLCAYHSTKRFVEENKFLEGIIPDDDTDDLSAFLNGTDDDEIDDLSELFSDDDDEEYGEDDLAKLIA